MARVWPAEEADSITRSLERAHLAGPNRTLVQDLTFAVDQLVEIAIRALSPAVNDTFTALTCVDWLSDGLSKNSARWDPNLVHRDGAGYVRVIAAAVHYDRFVAAAFDKIRQSSRGMPAVMIRQLDALAKIMASTINDEQREVLRVQGQMIVRSCDDSVPEANDRAEVHRHHDQLVAAVPAPIS
jgi:uncharacterized membrane protein